MVKIRKNEFFLVFDIQYGSQVKTRFPQISVFYKALVRLLSTENFRFIPFIPLELQALKNGWKLKNPPSAKIGQNF